MLPPGTSLAESKNIAEKVHHERTRIDGLKTFLSKTGLAAGRRLVAAEASEADLDADTQ